MFEYQAGEGLPLHTHAGQAAAVAVLDGRLGLSLDDQAFELPAGHVTRVQTDGFFSSQALEDGTRVPVTLLDLS
nr:cupin domain-containing protein [Deinococcus hopiensis]